MCARAKKHRIKPQDTTLFPGEGIWFAGVRRSRSSRYGPVSLEFSFDLFRNCKFYLVEIIDYPKTESATIPFHYINHSIVVALGGVILPGSHIFFLTQRNVLKVLETK